MLYLSLFLPCCASYAHTGADELKSFQKQPSPVKQSFVLAHADQIAYLRSIRGESEEVLLARSHRREVKLPSLFLSQRCIQFTCYHRIDFGSHHGQISSVAADWSQPPREAERFNASSPMDYVEPSESSSMEVSSANGGISTATDGTTVSAEREPEDCTSSDASNNLSSSLKGVTAVRPCAITAARPLLLLLLL